MPSDRANLLRAGYMESTVPFRCGTCAYASPAPKGAEQVVPSHKAGFCKHPKIMTVVDAVLGCCNHFTPGPKGKILFGKPQ